METKQAIISFSQSEKVKSGLIWCTQCAQIVENLEPVQQQGAVHLLKAMVAMLTNEIHLAAKVSGDGIWMEVDKMLGNARVMIESGVFQDAEFHFTQGLTQVNRIGQKSMTDLMEKGLLS